MDKAKSAKKSQTKALGGALNKMLGKDVFAEQKVYDLRTILKEEKQHHDVLQRWQKQAAQRLPADYVPRTQAQLTPPV